MRKIILFILLLAIASTHAWVDPAYVESTFKTALDNFRKGEYQRAHGQLTSLIMDSRGTQYYNATRFLTALSLYRLGNWESSAREFGEYARTFPESPYSATAKLYQGNAYYFKGDYLSSAESFLSAMRIAGEALPEVRANALASAKNLLWGYLTDDQLSILSGRLDGYSGQIVDYYRAQRFRHRGENRMALDVCSRALETRGAGEFTDSLKSISDALKGKITQNLTILVLAPTEGPYSDYGKEISNGVRLAVEQYNKDKRSNIQVVVENTAADPLIASLACQSAIRRNAPIAVIGPLLSPVAVPLAIICDQERVPLIMPTASKDGLSALSPFVYQISSPPSVGARTLALFAMDSLGINRFSALAPDDPTGRKAVDLFARTVEGRNAEMTSVTYYPDGTVDFSEHLARIRKPYYEEAKRISARADSSDLRFFTAEGKSREEGEWIMEIPGLFIPAYYEDLVNIIPQIPFNYIRARYLGENGWIIDRIRSMNAMHIDSSIVVPDDFWVDEGSSVWIEFSNTFRRAHGAKPGRVAALSYDSARLVLQGVERGLITPDQQRDYLSAIRGFTGPSGSITFDETGTNVDVQLIRFIGNRPEKIK